MGYIMEEDFVLERIRQLCEERGWTNYRLAVESGIPHSTLHNMMNRCTIPSFSSVMKICNAMGITMSEFFNGNEEASNLTTDQKDILMVYTKLSPEKKRAAIEILNVLDKKM